MHACDLWLWQYCVCVSHTKNYQSTLSVSMAGVNADDSKVGVLALDHMGSKVLAMQSEEYKAFTADEKKRLVKYCEIVRTFTALNPDTDDIDKSLESYEDEQLR